MKRSIAFITGLVLFCNLIIAQNISKKNLVKYISYLASDSLHGRGSGSPDELKAALYIAGVFEKYKLDYLPGTNTYLLPFSFKAKENPHSTDTSVGVVKNCRNVIGYLNNNASQTIVLGAHYDHLGFGFDNNSLDPNPHGKIHNGADDNASGTAGVMELARALSKQKGKLK
jgi:Zn-dependent M28 family amino/carboxypeptidase